MSTGCFTSKIIDSLHDDLREIISLNVNEVADTGTDSAVEGEAVDAPDATSTAPKIVPKAPVTVSKAVSAPVAPKAPVVAPKATAPTASKVPGSVMDRLGKKTVAVAQVPDENEALQEAIGDVDGDGIPDGTDAKKK